ncbi:MAG: hypothetical protein ABI345_04280 [Jatrophihabitans sp.]
MADLVLPAFEMDCREWIVINPSEVGLPDEVDGSPLLAVLTTMVIEDDIVEATGALTVGLLDGDDYNLREVAPGSAAHELIEFEAPECAWRFVMPTPNHKLALLAEFVVGEDAHGELGRRVAALMTSFRWQAA